MAKYTLSYFAFPGGRGEDCRLALHVTGADFKDDRVEPKDWPERKANTPFGAMPILVVEGVGTLSQSNAILAYLGRELGLHPADSFQAARHEAVMAAVEDVRNAVQATFGIHDAGAKQTAREKIAHETLPTWASSLEQEMALSPGEGPFFGGDEMNVVDLKVLVLMKWFVTGGVDHVPTDVFSEHAKLLRLFEATKSHPKIVEWYQTWGAF